MYKCINCKLDGCLSQDVNKMPKICPSRDKESQEDILKCYEEEENRKIAYYSALVEAEGYCQMTRLEETILFFKKSNYKKIGIAFCAGLQKEATQLEKILRYHDFEVVSVICKNGSLLKENIGLPKENIINGEEDNIMCNPIGQGEFLNKANVDYNIVFGLCVGHDSLVIKYLEKPVTVLGVKDRVLGHNPMAAIYQSESYLKNKIFPK